VCSSDLKSNYGLHAIGANAPLHDPERWAWTTIMVLPGIAGDFSLSDLRV
jgi:hypothetical protein